ncbi:hypothetical protein K0B96_10650 [Horticoccus luteus]|uniref:Uncharacterized protein n=1 Tax=Horticoccus luteus TaxID=2862869 RepID=A0A8F9TTD9_9BACT|nr:hypothetical protein [Horticoccus luteus]QYM77780.1 hypothetical protein K0B96_10650 [Horticoccus luteus]
MKRILPALLLGVVLTAGCSSISTRISSHRAAFDSWPADVRQKVEAGRIDVGFTPEQVTVAMGEPMRKYTRTTKDGAEEVWAYEDRKPRFSVGIGGGSYSGGGGVGGGVTVGGGSRGEDTARVVFANGRVSAIEQRVR